MRSAGEPREAAKPSQGGSPGASAEAPPTFVFGAGAAHTRTEDRQVQGGSLTASAAAHSNSNHAPRRGRRTRHQHKIEASRDRPCANARRAPVCETRVEADVKNANPPEDAFACSIKELCARLALPDEYAELIGQAAKKVSLQEQQMAAELHSQLAMAQANSPLPFRILKKAELWEILEKAQQRRLAQAQERRWDAKELAAIEIEEAPDGESGAEVADREARWKAELEASVAANGAECILTAVLTARLARMYAKLGRIDEAIELYERVRLFYLENSDRLPLGPRGCAGRYADPLADLYVRKYGHDGIDSAALLQIVEEGRILFCLELGMGHPAVAKSTWKMAMSLADFGHVAEAAEMFVEAHELDQALDDSARLATSRRCCLQADGHLAAVACWLDELSGRHDEAVNICRIAIDVAEQACEKCLADNCLGHWLNAMGNLCASNSDEAEPWFKRALEETERRKGPDHINTGRVACSLASIRLRNGCADEASVLAKRAVAIHEAVLGLAHEETEMALFCLSMVIAGQLLQATRAERARLAQGGSTELPWRFPLDDFYALRVRQYVLQTGKYPMASSSAMIQEALEMAAGRESQSDLAARSMDRVDRDGTDKAAAALCISEQQWAHARRFIDAILERSPGDVEARVLRIECALGAGEHAEAAKEAAALERRLPEGHAACLARAREARRKAEAALKKRAQEEAAAKKRAEAQAAKQRAEAEMAAKKRAEEAAAKKRAEKEARRKSEAEREQREREARERREREEAAAREQARRERKERRRRERMERKARLRQEEEERVASAAAAAAAAEATLTPESSMLHCAVSPAAGGSPRPDPPSPTPSSPPPLQPGSPSSSEQSQPSPPPAAFALRTRPTRPYMPPGIRFAGQPTMG